MSDIVQRLKSLHAHKVSAGWGYREGELEDLLDARTEIERLRALSPEPASKCKCERNSASVCQLKFRQCDGLSQDFYGEHCGNYTPDGMICGHDRACHNLTETDGAVKP